MSSRACFVHWKAPVRFVARTASQSSSGMRMVSPSRAMPALLTRTATGPKRARTSANARTTSCASATSAGTSPPVRATVTTVRPSARRRSAIAAPMPRVPPATTVTPPSGAGMQALLVAHDAPAPPAAPPAGRQRAGPAGAQPPVALGLVQSERDRGRRGVGHAPDIDDDAVGGDADVGRRCLDDAPVGLVGDEEVDVGDGEAGAVQRLG